MKFIDYCKEIGALGLSLTGIPNLINWLDGKNAPRIINYHNPDPEVFRTHLKWYKKRFTFVSLDQLVHAISIGNLGILPPRSLVITFDDGHKGNYALLDLFVEFKIRPTIYVCSGVVNTNRKFWFKAINKPQPYKRLSHKERLISLKQNYGYYPTREYPELDRSALNYDELHQLANVADIGCHTRFHPILTSLVESEINDEIGGSKVELENILGKSVNHFAYPNGDFSNREKEIVKTEGFKSARSINSDIIKVTDDIFELPNIGISDNASINLVNLQLCGLPKRFRNLINYGSFNGQYHPIIIKQLKP